MIEKLNLGGSPTPRKKYTPGFKAECVRQVVAGARQTDVARAGYFAGAAGPLAALGAGASHAQQRRARRNQAVARRTPARGNGARYFKKVVTIFAQPPPS